VETRVGGKLLRLRHCLLLPSPHFLRFPAEPGWPGAEQRPRSSWKEVYGTEHQGEGALGPREGGISPSPLQLPTEFTAQETPLVQQLHAEVYRVQGPKGQAGEGWEGAVKRIAGSGKGGGSNFLLPMGGDDGATDIAVGGHGIQLPPDVMGQTGLVQVILNHGQFTKSLQTRAKVQNV